MAIQISRQKHLESAEKLLFDNPAVALLGPRQVGKTTLAHEIGARHQEQYHYFDLELPADLIATKGIKNWI